MKLNGHFRGEFGSKKWADKLDLASLGTYCVIDCHEILDDPEYFEKLVTENTGTLFLFWLEMKDDYIHYNFVNDRSKYWKVRHTPNQLDQYVDEVEINDLLTDKYGLSYRYAIPDMPDTKMVWTLDTPKRYMEDCI